MVVSLGNLRADLVEEHGDGGSVTVYLVHTAVELFLVIVHGRLNGKLDEVREATTESEARREERGTGLGDSGGW